MGTMLFDIRHDRTVPSSAIAYSQSHRDVPQNQVPFLRLTNTNSDFKDL